MIPGILELASRTKYGMTSRNVPLYLFRPLNQTLSPCIVGCSKFSTANVLALVDVPKWETNKLTRGNLTRIIGKCGDFQAEKEAVTYQYRKKSWGPNITIHVPDISQERHHIAGVSFNIDPPGCVDIDDVFTIGSDGYYYITIADVAEWMKLNPVILRKAHELGQTLYSPEGRILQPMVPFQDSCSLDVLKQRLGVSLRFRLDDARPTDIQFLKTSIINHTTYSYDSIYESEYLPQLKHVVECLGCDSMNSHDWVAQLMIFYNIEAAKVLKQKGQGILRVHAEPDIDKLEQFEKLGADTKFLAFKSAKYVPATSNERHWGLNSDVYCHATSPIRRFADIINQFVLKDEQPPDADIYMLNQNTKELKQYARDMFFLEQLNTKDRRVYGVVLNDHRVWVPAWKRIVTCKNTEVDGTKGTLYFSLDMNQPTWKRRMVFKFVNTENQE